MKFTNVTFGSRLIETITSGLYDGNLNCIREYVQNSIDSNAKNIDIFFENGRDLVIKDDGGGMSREELIHALGIGNSKKTGENIGWRGIGIWSGVPASERIVIITKAKRNKKLRIEISNNLIRKAFQSDKDALTILTDASGEIEELELGNDESFEDSHMTIIRLESILLSQRTFFSTKEITKYLSRVVPASFEASFSFAGEINAFLKKNGVYFPDVKIRFQNKRVHRAPYSSEFFYPELVKNEFYDKSNNLIAVGWFLTAKQNKGLKWPNGGIFFKKKGFTIGDEYLIRNYCQCTYNQWQYGEIHIVDDQILENAARNSFEYNSGKVHDLEELTGEFIKEIQNVNRYKSDKKGNRKYPSHPLLQGLKKHVDGGSEKVKKETFESEAKSEPEKSSNLNPTLEAKAKPEPEKSSNLNPTLEAKAKPEPESDLISKPESKSESKDVAEELDQSKIYRAKTTDEHLEATINNLPISVRKSVKRVSKKNWEHLELSITDPLKDILQRKTGLTHNEILKLTQDAYGWRDVNILKGSKSILAIDKNKEIRNARFGVLIYAFHDLFVNLYKHERGNDSFKWYEDLCEEERKRLLAEIYATVGLIYRLIENSEKY